MDNEVVQTDSQRKFERLTKKPTEQFEQGTVQSSTSGTAMAAGRPKSVLRCEAIADQTDTQKVRVTRHC